MIPPSVSILQPTDWKNRLATAIRDPEQLLRLLDLPLSLLPAAIQAAAQFPLRVPRGFINRMHKADPHDPLLLQVLPLHLELDSDTGFVTDPTGDLPAMKQPGLLHKYAGRVLLITTGACGIHCRYCFRRHFPYGEAHLDDQSVSSILDYLQQDSSIHEVILSGGDPLVISDSRLRLLIQRLETISHVKRLRIHTRMPVIVPERVTPELIQTCSATRLQVICVIHCNHANEIDATVIQALQSLRDCGITLLNQAVLLKKINDNADTLIELNERLFSIGVQPYYLHQLDKVLGAAHFEVAPELALQLQSECRKRLPGYMLPRLVQEVEGEPYKMPLIELDRR
jgi:EF-P beta-lysylation protein EpmB